MFFISLQICHPRNSLHKVITKVADLQKNKHSIQLQLALIRMVRRGHIFQGSAAGTNPGIIVSMVN